MDFGAGIGSLNVTGRYYEGPAAVVQAKISVVNGQQVADQISVSQIAELFAQLQVSLLPGVNLAAGDSFPIVTSAGERGHFRQVSLPALPAPLTWDEIKYENTGATLKVK